MKVSELKGQQLAYWVARAQGWEVQRYSDRGGVIVINDSGTANNHYSPDLDWEQCGELIEEFNVELLRLSTGEWVGRRRCFNGVLSTYPKTAICRAVVDSVFGEEVDDER